LDADVVIHEHTHGLSARLHGNSSGLTSTMARGMGEGWSDFYAHSLLSNSSDPVDGVYTTGSYSTYLLAPSFMGNYYYGIRRFPKAIKSSTGPNGKPHNPLSFRHLNADCNAEIGTPTVIGSISAYPRGPFGSTTCDQVHAAGEIWSSALWEVRAKYVERLGWEIGNRRILQFVTDGMKLAPLNPTFLQERDAIIAAAQASGLSNADVADVWAGFAIRGMGFSAQIHNLSPARVTEAFDLPNVSQTLALTVSDSSGNNNGFIEPGENLMLTIPLTNNTGNDAENVSLQVVGGGAVSYGTILNNTTVSRQINFTVPANTPCGRALTITFNLTSSLGATSFTRTIIVGTPVITFTENFDGVTAPALPTGWTTTQTGAGTLFVTSSNTTDSAPNSVFTTNPSTVGGGADLISPEIQISALAATVTFRNKYDTEAGWDGGVLEISINGGAFQDILTAGGSFVEGGYNGTLGESTVNPLANRQAWTGNSGSFVTTTARLPATAKGQKIRLRFRLGADNNTAGTGWNIDTIKVAGSYSCSGVLTSNKSRADFDGDGKTDVSVFRPAEGNWYLSESSAGLKKIFWGAANDRLVPGDFDGDGRADTAVARPNANSTALVFYILNSSNSTSAEIAWGNSDDIPVVGDYDGDGKTDVAVYRPSNGAWYILKSRSGSFGVQFGATGDIPVPGDYDGDGKTDTAVFRPSNGVWYLLNSQTGFTAAQFGFSTDKLVPADYDGDGKDDIAVWRPSSGFWYVLKSTGGVNSTQFGISTDVPVPGDYDGDGKTDVAVFRSGTWFLNRSTAGFSAVIFGDGSDAPIPKQYNP
nr:M36 family metallopeptidase [Acidobacteriota bacterium]